MSTPAPFDSDYTATNFVGFSISIDIVASDQTLGANWQSLSLGSVSLGAQDLQAGGYNRSRFQMMGSLDYGNVTLTRPWTANQSGWIAQWFSAAETYQFGSFLIGKRVNFSVAHRTMHFFHRVSYMPYSFFCRTDSKRTILFCR